MKKVYINPKDRIPMVGDWVRFYQGGTLIISCVNYIQDEGRHYPYDTRLITDKGSIGISEVLEAR